MLHLRTEMSEASDLPRHHPHRCPKCGSHEVDRDRLPRFAEDLMRAVFNRRSYECLSCGARFYDRPSGMKHRPPD
jgi:DNA-directed RNA polymerase subunit RPC12/RpoP